MDYMHLIKLAKDSKRGVVEGNYSNERVSDTIRNALLEINGGSTKFNPRKFRPGTEQFDLLETLINVSRQEGLNKNNPLLNLVETVNIADGDINEFYTKGEANFIVADVASGTQGVRRQRILDGEKITVKTTRKIVKVYDHLDRFLSGRVDWNDVAQGVADSADKHTFANIYAAINGLSENTAGIDPEFVYTGSYDETRFLKMAEGLSAFTGKQVVGFGDLTSLRNVTLGAVGEKALTSKYDIGYYDSIAGIPLVRLTQSYIPGTKKFALTSNRIIMLAIDDKPIKHVIEGDGYLNEVPASANVDLTQEYTYAYKDGIGVIAAAPIGIYNISG